ncbi:MAG: hypothetical protein JF597_00050 [Streptomyces sp.]|uniref:hypothetical protein n=1 Tax=Streptomyces sp. TaxID=1931 RepID=UPI0025E05C28|nr:hypothetical protein [Streptomyces sp.]MBW8792041.1 hypothetical protein [Streptomyces sp.]
MVAGLRTGRMMPRVLGEDVPVHVPHLGAAEPAAPAGSYSRIMDRMTNAPDWITVASYENVDGRPTPLAAVRA